MSRVAIFIDGGYLDFALREMFRLRIPVTLRPLLISGKVLPPGITCRLLIPSHERELVGTHFTEEFSAKCALPRQ